MTQSHVAVVAFPFSSHAGSLFSLVRAMASLTPSTQFSFLSTKRSLASFNSQQLLPNISLIAISDGTTGTQQAVSHTGAIELFLKSFKESLREGLKTAELAQDCKFRCIVSDAFVWLTADVADEMAVKWVPVRTGSPHDLYLRLHADLVRQTIGIGEEANRSYGENKHLNFLPCLSDHRVMDLPVGVNTGDPNFIYFKICDQMALRLADSDILVVNTVEGLDFALDSYYKQKFSNYFPVGPFHLVNASQKAPPSDTYDCLSWLDSHQPGTVAYVSLGTIAFGCLEQSEVTSLAMGLEVSGVPFLWSLKEDLQSQLPSGFVDRVTETGKGKIVPWTPQTSVLKHSAVGAFVSHCGWNSVLESIVAGVPLVCRPFFGDQTINARLVSDVWKLGVALDGGYFSERGIVSAFDAMFKREEGKKIRNKAHDFQNLVIAAVDESGSTMKNMKRLLKFVCEC